MIKLIMVITLLPALVKGDELQDFVNTGEALRINCLLSGGTPVPQSEGQLTPLNCTNNTISNGEECLNRGGQFGQICMEESRCVEIPGLCIVDIPQELKTPIVEKYLERLFKRLREVAKLNSEPESDRKVEQTKSQLVQEWLVAPNNSQVPGGPKVISPEPEKRRRRVRRTRRRF